MTLKGLVALHQKTVMPHHTKQKGVCTPAMLPSAVTNRVVAGG
jgi:hypothetical protein